MRCGAPDARPAGRALPDGQRRGRAHRRRGRLARRPASATRSSSDGADRTVVGLVENPSDLDDEFALVAAASAGAPDGA